MYSFNLTILGWSKEANNLASLLKRKINCLLDVKFGEALIFWTNNFHYIPVNQEKKTRWSLNLRYKNLFTQYGTKNLLDYYDILKISPITKLLNNIDV